MTTKIRKEKRHHDFGTQWKNSRTRNIRITRSNLTADRSIRYASHPH